MDDSLPPKVSGAAVFDPEPQWLVSSPATSHSRNKTPLLSGAARGLNGPPCRPGAAFRKHQLRLRCTSKDGPWGCWERGHERHSPWVLGTEDRPSGQVSLI